MKNYIDHYCIVTSNLYSDGYSFCTGFKTLPTMRKKFKKMKEVLLAVPDCNKPQHQEVLLVARNYDREIIKIYDSFSWGWSDVL